mgnify:CR=1 FL=1
MTDMQVTFPGGKRVDAHLDGHTIRTDQAVEAGGDGSAVEPFDLFFVSIATCVGIYVLEFCNRRNLDTTGLGLRLLSERDPEAKRHTAVHIDIDLPRGFPAKYRKSILSTANLCTVKKHIMLPPEFDIRLSDERAAVPGTREREVAVAAG